VRWTLHTGQIDKVADAAQQGFAFWAAKARQSHDRLEKFPQSRPQKAKEDRESEIEI
jgi:hypothetical protein